jgi:hypothetical protein
MPTDARLGLLLAHCVEKLDRGEQLRLEEVCGACPELLPQLQVLLRNERPAWRSAAAEGSALPGFPNVTPPPDSARTQYGPTPAAVSPGEVHTGVPGFEVLGELGRGEWASSITRGRPTSTARWP